jgi:hypothetical protein
VKTINFKQPKLAKPRKWFQRRRCWHDPMLVFNMSIFNSENLRILNRLPSHENVWGAHAPRVSFSAPSPKSSFLFTANRLSS